VQACGVLQQAAATQHEDIHGDQPMHHHSQSPSITGLHPEALAHPTLIPRGDDGLAPGGQPGEKHLQQGIIAEVVFAVVTTEQGSFWCPLPRHALQTLWARP
ncbi:MAG: hypothetical protein ACK56I_08570, partial [bacterium]